MEYLLTHDAMILEGPGLYRIVGDAASQDRNTVIDITVDSKTFIAGCKILWDIDTGATIKIGKFTSIARDTVMELNYGRHRSGWAAVYPCPLMPLLDSKPTPRHGTWDISIGNDVWIGDGARILSGVTIGDGAIVGSGAIVTENVPPYAVCVGNPGTIKKYRFPQLEREFFLEAKWWDMPMEVLDRLSPYLASSDIGETKRQIVMEQSRQRGA